jgi:hypothetical protein
MYTIWTEDEEKLLVHFYPNSHLKALVKLFQGRFDHVKIKNKAIKKGLRKSERYYQDIFTKNSNPWNKGLTLNPDLKQYQMPGFGRIRKNRNGYLEVWHQGKFQVLSHIIWEKHHGKPVPHGMTLRYADGNKDNVDINNLVLTSRSEVIREHSFSNYPKEIREVHLINKEINRIINE